MDLEPEGKVFVVITLTGSFTEGKKKFWVVFDVCKILIGIPVIEILRKAFLE